VVSLVRRRGMEMVKSCLYRKRTKTVRILRNADGMS
jgi:hypothetical protein